MRVRKSKVVVCQLIFLINFVTDISLCLGYGYNKKKGELSLYNTSIVRNYQDKNGDENGVVRNDVSIKYGITDWFTLFGETSLIGGGQKEHGFFGLNYQAFTGMFQLYRGEKIGLNIGFGFRTPTYIINKEYGEWIGGGGRMKFLCEVGLDWRIDKNNTLGFKVMYRNNNGNNGSYYDYWRFNVDWFLKINDKFSTRVFWWETFSTRGIKYSAALVEIAGYYRITKEIQIGFGISYYWRHDLSKGYNWRNHSLLLLLEYKIK